MSPDMHNFAFKKLGIDAEYEAVDVVNIQEFIGYLDDDFLGFNVTIPHKQAIIKYIDDIDEKARAIGAVNTVKISYGIEGRRLIGYNTDCDGAIMSLKSKVGKIGGKRIVLIGAGGAARAIAYELAKEQCKIRICNRTSANAESLAIWLNSIFDCDARSGNLTNIGKYDILINSTSVGMHPNVDLCPVDESEIIPRSIVMDIVYNPLDTWLLKVAHEKGCTTIDGVGMLVYQGVKSMKIILNIDEPVDDMIELVRNKLNDNRPNNRV
ncbi:shikimate dehydrogenase [Candidatus Woesearchaeota archaeon]|nr:shikimate dehydrogenase [Candidatus Woesearchaeota archaeon]